MSKTRPCALCLKRPRTARLFNPDLCHPCYEYCGWENTHSDEGHDNMSANDPTEATYLADCPICQGVPAPWLTKEEPVKNATTTRPARNVANTRHMSHADCQHPRTPKGRAACRKSLRTPSGAPLTRAVMPNVLIGKSKNVHVAGGCTTVRKHNGSIERTDSPVTCKNCMKVPAPVA